MFSLVRTTFLPLTFKFQTHKAHRTCISEKLMPVAWHLNIWWDWCVPRVEKKEMFIPMFVPIFIEELWSVCR